VGVLGDIYIYIYIYIYRERERERERERVNVSVVYVEFVYPVESLPMDLVVAMRYMATLRRT